MNSLFCCTLLVCLLAFTSSLPSTSVVAQVSDADRADPYYFDPTSREDGQIPEMSEELLEAIRNRDVIPATAHQHEEVILPDTAFTGKCHKGWSLSTGTCAPCNPAQYTDEVDSPACKPCPPGTATDRVATTKCTRCPPGTRALEGTRCVMCAAGTFATGNEHSDVDGGASECTPCPKGFAQKGIGREMCDECPVGTFSPTVGQSHCRFCETGFYQDENGQETCLPCPEGREAILRGSKSCAKCRKGYYLNAKEGMKACTACPPGSFADGKGRSKCDLCPPGTWNGGLYIRRCRTCPSPANPDAVGATECPSDEDGTLETKAYLQEEELIRQTRASALPLADISATIESLKKTKFNHDEL